MPTLKNYAFADTPHERTVQRPGDLYHCNSIVTGSPFFFGEPFVQ